jgi:hypothetical protein
MIKSEPLKISMAFESSAALIERDSGLKREDFPTA